MIDGGFIKIALKDSLQAQQTLVDCTTFLPLLNYHNSDFMAKPTTKLIPEVLTHTTDMVVIDPTYDYLVQLGEDYV